MIAWSQKPSGQDSVVVFSGVADWDGAVLTMRREPQESSFVVRSEWLARIKPVTPDLAETLLGAAYAFSVTIGTLNDDADPSLYRMTGLRWPCDSEGSA